MDGEVFCPGCGCTVAKEIEKTEISYIMLFIVSSKQSYPIISGWLYSYIYLEKSNEKCYS